jgi:hypothetical protein
MLLALGYSTVATVERIDWPATSARGPSTSAPPMSTLDFSIGTGIRERLP